MASTFIAMFGALSAAIGAQPDTDIVVEGRADLEEVKTDVRTISDVRDSQLARFADPVCPGVGGMGTSMSIGILDEMRTLIGDLGIDLADEDCDPNLFVVIAHDTRAAIKDLRKKRPPLFAMMSGPDYRLLMEDGRPSRFWQATVPKGRYGEPVQAIDSIRIPNRSGIIHEKRVAKGAVMLDTRGHGRARNQLRRDVQQSFLYLEADALEGLTVRQIAHYAVAVGLTPVAHDAGERLERASILSLFEDRKQGAAPLPALSAFDRAFIEANYAGDHAVDARSRQRQIAQNVRRAMAED